MNAHLSAASWRKRAACRGVDPEVFYPVTDDEAEHREVHLLHLPGPRSVPRARPVGPRARGDLGRRDRTGASSDPAPAQEVCLALSARNLCRVLWWSDRPGRYSCVPAWGLAREAVRPDDAAQRKEQMIRGPDRPRAGSSPPCSLLVSLQSASPLAARARLLPRQSSHAPRRTVDAVLLAAQRGISDRTAHVTMTASTTGPGVNPVVGQWSGRLHEPERAT